MLQVNLPVFDTIHAKNNKFVMGVKIKATVNSKLNDSPGCGILLLHLTIYPLFSWHL